MFKHKLFELLKTFSKTEITGLKSYITSPYFNSSRKIITLLNEIIKYYPRFTSPRLTKENLGKKISKSGNYNDSTMRDAMSTLLVLAQKFLMQLSIEKNTFESVNYLLSELSKRKQQFLFERSTHKLEEDIEKIEGIDSRYLYSKYMLETNKFNYSVINNKVVNKEDVFQQFDKLTKSGVYLTYFFITELISEYLNLFTYSRKYNIDYKENKIYKYLNTLTISKVKETFKTDDEYAFLLDLYMSLFETFSNFNDEKKYMKYKKMVIEYSDKLSRDERSFHYSRLINYCIMKKQSHADIQKYDLELFEIYEYILDKEYYSDRKMDHLATDLYRDILLQALSLKKFDWAENFIKVYSKKVHPKETENMLYLGYAYLTYEKKEFSKTLDHLNRVSVNNIIHKYDIRNLLLKAYYELGYTEESLYEIHSYREFLRKNKLVSENRRLRFGNFLKFLEKLILIKEQKSRFKIGYVKQNLARTEDVSYKEWLLEHYEALEKQLEAGTQ